MLLVILILIGFGILLAYLPSAPRVLAYPINRLMSKIWTPELPRIKKETLDRIKELYVDGNIPEETAILIAAKEDNVTEQEILSAINAVDAKDLIALLTGGKRSVVSTMIRLMKKTTNERPHR